MQAKIENYEYTEDELSSLRGQEQKRILSEQKENEVTVRELIDFNPDHDMDFFHSLEGEDGWIAIGMENCMNQQYFMVVGNNNEKLGIVGVYDTEDEKNITHVVINPEYRSKKIGKSLLPEFYDQLKNKTGIKSLTATINPENIASVKSHEKAGFKKVDDPNYGRKLKYKYDTE